MDDRPKRALIVGDINSASSQRWKEWAERNGFVVEHKTMEQLELEREEHQPLLILDEVGLNDHPLPKRTVIVGGGRMAGRSLALAALAAVVAKETAVAPTTFHIRAMRSYQERITTNGRQTQSKGDKHRNRKFRWT